jgi:hypothetical protein
MDTSRIVAKCKYFLETGGLAVKPGVLEDGLVRKSRLCNSSVV